MSEKLSASEPVHPDPAPMKHSELPLVYACSGCSSAAQLANHLAVRLDRGGDAEMSCIAGVGGGVKPLVQTAQRALQAGRPILAIDGCALACVRASLARVGVQASLELRLHELGVRKIQHGDFDPAQAEELLGLCRTQLGELRSSQ